MPLHSAGAGPTTREKDRQKNTTANENTKNENVSVVRKEKILAPLTIVIPCVRIHPRNYVPETVVFLVSSGFSLFSQMSCYYHKQLTMTSWAAKAHAKMYMTFSEPFII